MPKYVVLERTTIIEKSSSAQRQIKSSSRRYVTRQQLPVSFVLKMVVGERHCISLNNFFSFFTVKMSVKMKIVIRVMLHNCGESCEVRVDGWCAEIFRSQLKKQCCDDTIGNTRK